MTSANPNYTITKVKQFRGREGYGLNATILKDGKPIAFVLDQADGGDVQFDFTNPGQNAKSYAMHSPGARAEEAAFIEFCQKWWTESGADKEWAEEFAKVGGSRWRESETSPRLIMDRWVSSLVDAEKFNRMSKKNTLFRLKGDSRGMWRKVNIPAGTPEAAAWIAAQKNVEEVWAVKS